MVNPCLEFECNSEWMGELLGFAKGRVRTVSGGGNCLHGYTAEDIVARVMDSIYAHIESGVLKVAAMTPAAIKDKARGRINGIITMLRRRQIVPFEDEAEGAFTVDDFEFDRNRSFDMKTALGGQVLRLARLHTNRYVGRLTVFIARTGMASPKSLAQIGFLHWGIRRGYFQILRSIQSDRRGTVEVLLDVYAMTGGSAEQQKISQIKRQVDDLIVEASQLVLGRSESEGRMIAKAVGHCLREPAAA